MVWGEKWTLCKVSQSVEIIVQILIILFLCLKGATMDHPRIGYCRCNTPTVWLIVSHSDKIVYVWIVAWCVAHVLSCVVHILSIETKKHPVGCLCHFINWSVPRTCREVNLIAQFQVDRVTNPNVENQGQVTVDRVLWSIFRKTNPNPVSRV